VIARGIGEVLGEGDERALVGSSAQDGDRFEALVGRHFLGAGRQLHKAERGRQAVLANVEAADAVLALK
jgi:hypothetical protein